MVVTCKYRYVRFEKRDPDQEYSSYTAASVISGVGKKFKTRETISPRVEGPYLWKIAIEGISTILGLKKRVRRVGPIYRVYLNQEWPHRRVKAVAYRLMAFLVDYAVYRVQGPIKQCQFF